MYRVTNHFYVTDFVTGIDSRKYCKVYYIKTKDLLGFLRAKRIFGNYNVTKINGSLIYDCSEKYTSDLLVVTKIA